jgi:hypothetical protein
MEAPMITAHISEWLSPTRAARRLNVSSQSIINWCEDGRLVSYKTLLGRLIDPASVEALAAERAEQKGAKEVQRAGAR